jgi:hypothetical protein
MASIGNYSQESRSKNLQEAMVFQVGYMQENNHSRLRLLKRRASSPFIYLPTMVLPWRYDPTTTPSLESNSNSVLQSNSTKGKDFCSLDQRKGNILGSGKAKHIRRQAFYFAFSGGKPTGSKWDENC